MYDLLKKKNRYLILIFWIGFTSLIYEIYSTKVLFLFFLETSQAVTIAISAFLAGLAFSSLLFSSFSKKSTKNNLFIIFLMQVVVALYGYFVLKEYVFIPQVIDFLHQHILNQDMSSFLKISLIWIYLFIPAFFIGGSFPLVNGLYLKNLEEGTRDTGIVYFWDTFGSILGAFLAGFWLLPQLGFRLTCVVAVVINLCIALIVAPKKEWRGAIVLFLILIFFNEYNFYQANKIPSLAPSLSGAISTTSTPTALPTLSPEPTPSSYSFIPEYPQLDAMFGKILFQKISPFGRITIGEDVFGDPNDKALFINYRDMCHSQSHVSESEMGSLVAQQAPVGSRILNIGLGCGFTADAIAQQPSVSRLDIAEINPVVAEGTKEFFQKENSYVLENPKTDLYIEDGAEFIRNAPNNTYDGIVIDIEEATIIYSSPLYTREYFALASKKMKPEGVLALWAHRGSNDFEKVIYNTLKSVFPNVNIVIIDGFYTFYASNSPAHLPVSPSPEEPMASQQIDDMLNTPNNEINTLDNKVLEKYFDVQSYFNLPTSYKEQFLSPAN